MEVGDHAGNIEATRALAGFVARTQYEDLPASITDKVKRSILDTIGIILPAQIIVPGISGAIQLMIDAGGKREGTVFGYGVKLPCWAAAFANGIRAHVLDYADGHLEAILRVGVSVVPPALALAERIGHVSGKELIAAVAVGEEVICRLGVAVARKRRELGPWHCGVLFGNFGATATACRLLGLDEGKVERAFGIVYMQTAGSLELTSSVESNLRGMYPGFVGSAGMLAALLAEKDILGPWGTLESRYGLFPTYFQNEYDRRVVVDGLGREFELANLSFKPWPSCALSHQYIDATLRLVSEQNLRPEDIAEINIAVGEICRDLCEPIEKRRVPLTINDAKYNIPFAVAIAASKRNVVNRDFTPEGFRDSAVLEMAKKIRITIDPELNKAETASGGNRLPPGRIEIKNRGNRVFSQRVDFPYGHHLNPMTMDDLVAKFRDCAAFPGVSISEANVEKVISTVMNLEGVGDVSLIPQLLS